MRVFNWQSVSAGKRKIGMGMINYSVIDGVGMIEQGDTAIIPNEQY